MNKIVKSIRFRHTDFYHFFCNSNFLSVWPLNTAGDCINTNLEIFSSYFSSVNALIFESSISDLFSVQHKSPLNITQRVSWLYHSQRHVIITFPIIKKANFSNFLLNICLATVVNSSSSFLTLTVIILPDKIITVQLQVIR